MNEAGLAVASAPAETATLAWPRYAAPAYLLVQECLQRFTDVAGATSWCRARPAGGAATILLADAAGRLGAVVVDGERRELRGTDDGVLASAGAGAEALVAGTKPLREGDGTDRALEAALAALRDAAGAKGTPSTVALDPLAREIRWLAPDGTLGRLEA